VALDWLAKRISRQAAASRKANVVPLRRAA